MAEQRRPHPGRKPAPSRTSSPKPARTVRSASSKSASTRSTSRATSTRTVRAGSTPTHKPATRKPQASTPRRTTPLVLPLAAAPRRLQAILLVVAIALSLFAGRLLQLQGFDSAAYAAAAADDLTRTIPLLPVRGEISDRNGIVLAATEPAVVVIADPKLTDDKRNEIAQIMTGYLDVSSAELVPLLTKQPAKPDNRYVKVKAKVPAATYSAMAKRLSEAGLKGISRESDAIRTYPGGSVGGSVVGFVNTDGEGLAGLEYAFNKELTGVKGEESYERGPNGSKIPLGDSSLTPAKDGVDYQLTLDGPLQWAAERLIADKVRQARADYGFAITINIKTGEVLALANAPTLDSSDPTASQAKDRTNRAVSAAYEPGSVQKLLTAGAILDSGTADPDDRLQIPSRLQSGDHRIKDHFEHGTIKLNFRGVIANSSNIGTAMLARKMDRAQLQAYLKSFGLGAKTGIETPGEATGSLPKPDMPGYTRDQIAFGQALSVTGIQEAAAVAGLLNDGVYNAPTVIRSATDSDGNPVVTRRAEPRRVISSEASDDLRDLMRAVVDSPNGQKRLALNQYQSGGKTGTAQRYDPKSKGYKGYTTSYIGFAPLDDPQILTYVVVDNPRRGDTGSGVAAPVYKAIMEMALPRYSILPNTKRLEPKPTEW